MDNNNGNNRARTAGFARGAPLLLVLLAALVLIMALGGGGEEPPAASEPVSTPVETAPPQETAAPYTPEPTATPSPTPTPAVHVISAIAGRGGSISPAGAVEVEEGGSVTFTITPESGYAADQLLVDGESVEVSGTYTFSGVTSDHTIYVTFREELPPVPSYGQETEPPVFTAPPVEEPFPPEESPTEQPSQLPSGDIDEILDWLIGSGQP